MLFIIKYIAVYVIYICVYTCIHAYMCIIIVNQEKNQAIDRYLEIAKVRELA